MLDSAIKASVIVALALAANGLLRARSAALRHWVLAAAVACALAVPALEVLVPAWNVPFAHAERGQTVARTTVPAEGSATARYTAIGGGARPAPAATPQHVASRVRIAAALEWFSWLWMTGTVGSLAVLLLGLWRLARLASHASPLESARWRAAATAIADEYGVRRPLRLLVGDRPALLVTWGHRRPIVLVPASAASWPDDRVRVVLGHEIAHIYRNDWLIVIIGGNAPRLLLVQPADVDRLSASASRKRAGLRRCGAARRRRGIGICVASARCREVTGPAPPLSAAGACHGSSIEPRKENWCHVESASQSRSRHACGAPRDDGRGAWADGERRGISGRGTDLRKCLGVGRGLDQSDDL